MKVAQYHGYFGGVKLIIDWIVSSLVGNKINHQLKNDGSHSDGDQLQLMTLAGITQSHYCAGFHTTTHVTLLHYLQYVNYFYHICLS